jgi:hypothetical protein
VFHDKYIVISGKNTHFNGIVYLFNKIVTNSYFSKQILLNIFFKHNKKKFLPMFFLSEKTRLPMMYMYDAVNATLQLMQTDSENVKNRTGYNLAAISFTP